MAPTSFPAISMVTSAKISNFRGFKDLEVNDLAPINVIVGDNAIGKTAFLEAIYLAVSGNAQQPFTLKQWRGQEIKFQTGSADSVVEGFYADLFHDAKSSDPIVIKLIGKGFENRKLTISRSRGDIILTTKGVKGPLNRRERRAEKSKAPSKDNLSFQQPSQSATVPILLSWTDEYENKHDTRVFLSPSGVQSKVLMNNCRIAFSTLLRQVFRRLRLPLIFWH
jgi:AAA15 family ATPase/GTPase